MRFRSETPVRVVSEDGVHSAIIGTDFRPLPAPLHQVAMQTRGVEFDAQTGKVKDVEQKAADPDALSQTGEEGVIRKAITALLTKNDDADFTTEGRPRVDAVNSASGANHTKEDVARIWDLMSAEQTAKAAESAKATEPAKADKAAKGKK